ncbi:rhodanese-like domain-containing protein [Haloarchaeobius sp. FL176]|uniref:MBL fold metallo-hydrolase n=1 Tax=Haloarchaeobius sp. FL176 TaxID=2967129 RepID=UPI00214880E1|nr:rhodanese-like domain-containing protein [Haloarchaeobius sp. FL176]
MSVPSEADDAPPSVSPRALDELLRSGEPFTLLDVRDRDEFEAWHVDGPGVSAVQVPHVKFVQAQVTGDVDSLVGEDPAEPIVAVCGHGEASAHAAELLVEAGHDARNLAGGMDAWARLLVARDVEAASGTVVQYDRPSSGCLSYMVVDGGEAAVVDPLRAFADRYVADANERGADLRYAIDTHVHADHVSGVRAVATVSDAEPVLPELARERGLAYDVRPLADGETLTVGGTDIEAVATPGHTTEMTTLAASGVLFTGDGLFVDTVARPDLEEGDEGAAELAAELYDSLQEGLLRFPDSMVVAPGHRDDGTPRAEDGTVTATLGTVRDRVEALSLGRDEFVDYVLAALPPQPNEYERIIETNLGRETLDDEDAFAVELGPNNCAAR